MKNRYLLLSVLIEFEPVSSMARCEAISIVKQHGLQSLLHNPIFKLLVAKKSDIERLRAPYVIDQNRLVIENLKSVRMATISVFKLNVTLLSKTSTMLDLHPIQNAIENNLLHIYNCRNESELS